MWLLTKECFFFLLIAFPFHLPLSLKGDIVPELKMVVEDVPAWLQDLEKLLLDSPSEILRSKADSIVSQDGSGDFKTLTEAVIAAPNNSITRFVIYVKRGTYNEVVEIGKTKTNLTIVGDGLHDTILTGNLNGKDGVSTFQSSTLGVSGDGFVAQDICIRNTAGPEKGQAVALRVSSDKAVFYRCRIDAYQDSLYAYKFRQFYRDCQITGTVDFICGDATAVFQNCQIEARKPLVGQTNVITAQSLNKTTEVTGFSFHKCNITASPDLTPMKATVKTFLGRPWGLYSRVVFMECFLDDLIAPEGYTPWNSEMKGLSTLFYGEYKNIGPGADTSRRVDWKGFKIISDPKEASSFTVGQLINKDSWLNSTGVPYDDGL